MHPGTLDKVAEIIWSHCLPAAVLLEIVQRLIENRHSISRLLRAHCQQQGGGRVKWIFFTVCKLSEECFCPGQVLLLNVVCD